MLLTSVVKDRRYSGTLTTFSTRINAHCRVLCTSRWDLEIQNVMSMLAISSLKIQADQVGGDVFSLLTVHFSER